MTDTTIFTSDMELIQRLRNGEESAFAYLVDKYQNLLLRMALMYVHDREIAEDVVQETWISVLKALDKFEGRSSLKTWIISILINRAKTRAQREGRSLPFSSLESLEEESDSPTVEPERFTAEGNWRTFPDTWEDVPEERLLSQETSDVIRRTIEKLSPNQRDVITLRDIDGLSSDEVRNVLNISETNQRVLLHRARASVRRSLERYLGKKE